MHTFAAAVDPFVLSAIDAECSASALIAIHCAVVPQITLPSFLLPLLGPSLPIMLNTCACLCFEFNGVFMAVTVLLLLAS